jgi:hypothetical protein
MDMNNLGFEEGYLEDNKSDHSEECVHDLVVLGNWQFSIERLRCGIAWQCTLVGIRLIASHGHGMGVRARIGLMER